MLSEIPKSQKIVVMLGVMSALLLSSLDQTIVATAMPRIVQELAGLKYLSWVFTAYLLASTVVVPLSGKLSDIYGRKIFYIGGILIFLLGSVLSGFSQSMVQLIIFRAIQGIGGGAIMSSSFTIIGDLFPPSERGKWQGMLGGVYGFSSVAGPIAGGWLTDNASWRWTFFINIPVGILALTLIILLLPKFAPSIKEKVIDYQGSIALTVGLVSLLLGLVWGGNLLLFLVSFASLIAFAIIESKVKSPIIPLGLFKNSTFSISMLIIFLLGIGKFGSIIYVPLFAQAVLGFSATNSGTILTPLTFGLIFSSFLSGQIISRTGKYKFLAILGLTIIPIALFLLSRMNSETTQSELILRTVLAGVGLGIIMPIFTIAVQNAFDHSKLGVVTASSQLFRAVGGTVGIAIMAGILNNSLSSKLASQSSEKFIKTFSGDVTLNKLQNFLSNASQFELHSEFGIKIKQILAQSIGDVFLIGALLMLIALIASFFLKERPLRKTHAIRSRLEEAGIEIAVEEGEFRAKDAPRV